jgi:ATP-dependent protease HslVU (ClpYQ) ATPase subunit
LAELQGRLPIRVELKPLTREDLYKVLTEPQFNLIVQQRELMKTEVSFDPWQLKLIICGVGSECHLYGIGDQ